VQLKELVELRLVSERITEATEMLNSCLYVLALSKKVKIYAESVQAVVYPFLVCDLSV